MIIPHIVSYTCMITSDVNVSYYISLYRPEVIVDYQNFLILLTTTKIYPPFHPNNMKFVLDTSAILSGKDFSSDYELYSSPMIIEELKHGRMRRRLEFLLESGLRVMSPSEDIMKEVRKCAEDTGDIARVSEADLEILSLAKELNAVLLSDDYSIQNIASKLKVDFKGVAQDGITEIFKWEYRCKGCARYWEKMHDACPVCGSELKTTRKK
jgi:UPF0271 protein